MNAQDRRTNRNAIERVLGAKTFNKLFPVILTDNGSEFSNPKEIEYRDAVPSLRTKVFYCDPSSPYQKGACEVNHELIRDAFSFYYGEDLLKKLGCSPVAAENIILKPKLLKE